MEHSENQAVIAFDTLYTQNHIQILKVLLPYFDSEKQKNMAVMIKFMELQYTMEYVNRHPADLSCASMGRKDGQPPDIVEIFEQIKNFCTPTERAMFDQLANMKKSMEMYQEMTDMMQLFGQLSPESGSSLFGSGLFGSADPEDHSAASGAAASAGEASEDPDTAGTDCGSREDASSDGPDVQNFSGFGNTNPLDMLKGMLSPEQQAMFEMFQSSFGGGNQNNP